ncbi:hypothetical protein EON81_02520 [bacterium]|nr:MAG: hypothetical protein EON81_02520 [bacterium]
MAVAPPHSETPEDGGFDERSLSQSQPGDPMDIVRREYQRADRRDRQRQETQEGVQQRQAEIDMLVEQRRKARLELCARLGDFGLVYDAEKHDIVRVGLKDPPRPEPRADKPGTVRDAFDPKNYDIPPKAPDAKEPKLLKWLDALGWVAVPFLGAFLGYSIGLLAGLPVKAQLEFAVASIVFGVFLLAGMKASIYTILHHVSRRAATTGLKVWLGFGWAVVALLIAAEATLGSVAIIRYSQDRAFRPEEVLPWYVALVVAVCFSTPVLIASAVKGGYDGSQHDDDRERMLHEARTHNAAVAKAQQDHEAAQRQLDAESLERHKEALTRFQTEHEKQISNDRWKSAMSLFGAITVLNIELSDAEKRLTSYKISRGYENSAEEKRNA